MSDKKINKEAFLASVAEEIDVPYGTVKKVAHGLYMKLEELVFSGQKLSLKGFGTFYKQYHKGHPVQFGKKGEEVAPYPIFKFSASHLLNQRIRKYDGHMDEYLADRDGGESEDHQ